MAQGFRSVWPTYKAEMGDTISIPHDLGFNGSNIDVQIGRAMTARAIADTNRREKVVDRGGKPSYVVELDSLFAQLKKLQQASKSSLMAGRVKSALIDLARLRSKLSTHAKRGQSLAEAQSKIVGGTADEFKTKAKEAMATATRKEVALFRARWSSLLEVVCK